jgi:hypothetical protein
VGKKVLEMPIALFHISRRSAYQSNFAGRITRYLYCNFI